MVVCVAEKKCYLIAVVRERPFMAALSRSARDAGRPIAAYQSSDLSAPKRPFGVRQLVADLMEGHQCAAHAVREAASAGASSPHALRSLVVARRCFSRSLGVIMHSVCGPRVGTCRQPAPRQSVAVVQQGGRD